MVSVEQAKKQLEEYTPALGRQSIRLNRSIGFVLAGNVHSPIDMPPFPQSAMDGYALGPGPRTTGSTFKVIGEVAAGSAHQFTLTDGEAVRIFTGAPVPESAVAVVQQEWTHADENTITLEKEVAERMHIRPQGEQMQTNDIALEKGTILNPAAIGFLNMLGLTEVEVFSKPKVAVLVTGNELITPGDPLDHGQIYESNSAMLVSALGIEGIRTSSVRIPDDLVQTVQAIDAALVENDMIILSGGISVGDHDHVGTALNKLGVQEVFYKVKQKPGKPIFFGTIKGKAVFALPGNPAASLSCFYTYVVPTIRRMQNHPSPQLEKRMLVLKDDYIKKGDRAVFLKGRTTTENVEILNDQSSAMLNSFAIADCLVYFDENSDGAKSGDTVTAYMLP